MASFALHGIGVSRGIAIGRALHDLLAGANGGAARFRQRQLQATRMNLLQMVKSEVAGFNNQRG